MVKKNKKGFYVLGNGMMINENQVKEVGNDYIITKSGDKYNFKEMPDNDNHCYLGELYGTIRDKYE